jgi:uncharacterized membrane protein
VTRDHAAVIDAALMTNPYPTQCTANGEPSHYNVVAISFDDDQNAYPALTKLKELDAQGQLSVQEAMVVQRAADGTVAVEDRIGTMELAGTATGTLLGLMIGVLGGPVGVLIGGYSGLLFGSLYDLDDSEQIETTLGEISKTVQPDRSAVLAVISEQNFEVADVSMASFGGKVLRRDVYDVETEVAAAAKAERKAAREAQLELMRAKRDQTRESARATVEELKAKLSHGNGEHATKQTAGATS